MTSEPSETPYIPNCIVKMRLPIQKVNFFVRQLITTPSRMLFFSRAFFVSHSEIMPLPRQKRLKVLAQLLIRLRQRKQFVRQKRQQKLLLNLPKVPYFLCNNERIRGWLQSDFCIHKFIAWSSLLKLQ